MICPICKKEMVKHIIKEGARYHVHSSHRPQSRDNKNVRGPDMQGHIGPRSPRGVYSSEIPL